MKNTSTVRFRVYGIVQGVGFRPTVDRHAKTAGVRGSVCNKGPYVEIYAQGTEAEIDRFHRLLDEAPPRRAAILKIDTKPAPDAPFFSEFSIVESEKTSGEIYISPDIAICEECEQEMYDPGNRRYLHPFINCTCCGPRMTILDALPYDRERTSMKMFPMCKPCAEEYYGAWSRRYDAQPVCCNNCGPEVYLLQPGEGKRRDPLQPGEGKRRDPLRPGEEKKAAGTAGTENSVGGSAAGAGRTTRGGVQAQVIGREAITEARRMILDGGIVAVKGIGGFHLCCDATNEAAVAKLRTRKRRPAKPFAVMMRDEETVRRECIFNEEQRLILTGHQKPILLLERRENSREYSLPGNRPGTGSADSQCLLAPSVAPGNPKVGVMLPYAPLQHLLFRYDDGLQMPDCLVMTSGNVSGAPICRDDADALAELSGFCDCILSHDRLIRIRADDSVMDFHRGHPYMIRRSRGYAPLPVLLSGFPAETSPDRYGKEKNTCVLAVGGELKNTFCIASGNLLYLSPYVGDLEDLRTVHALEETIGRMETLLEVTPQAVVCDLHPKYNSTMAAEEIARQRQIPVLRIQHHYAHILSCMAENDRSDSVIGVSFDGTGYGTDGTIWGGEILTADYSGFAREYSIAPFVQIGGDSAPRQGWRIAASMLWSFCKEEAAEAEGEDPVTRYLALVDELSLCDAQNAKAQRMMAERGIQAVVSTSAGRLFDAVSAMLGICRESTYEGEASIELEFAAERFIRAKLEKKEKSEPGSSAGSSTGERSVRAKKEKKEDTVEGFFPGSPTAECSAMDTWSTYLSFSEESRQLPTDRLFADLLRRRLAGDDPEELAYLFHEALAGLIVEACARTSARTGIRTAALSGGCYQNRLLLSLTEEGLRQRGIEVLIHHLVPPNDGGIALGQAAAALMRIQTNRL